MEIQNRFEDAKVSDFNAEIIAKVKNGLENKDGLFIHGPCGTGKTRLAYAIKNRLAEMGKPVRLFSFPQLLRTLKTEMALGETRTTLDRILDFSFGPRVLVLDDIGSEKMTEWALETLFLIVDTYYTYRQRIIFTSNKSLKEIAELTGDRVASRLAESCEIIKLDGEDKRLQ